MGGKVNVVSKASVLVVDDNRDILDFLCRLLKSNDFESFPAKDYLTAFDLLDLHHPDVVLIDLMMPDLTGIEFIRHVREKAEYGDLPIIAMSAYDRSYLVAALLAGANSALHKPEDLDTLVETIKQVLGRRDSGAVA
jgi:DNA-binding response OmpR family regulator